MKYLILFLLTSSFCLASPIHEYWTNNGSTENLACLDGLTSEQIESRLRLLGGMYITGRVKHQEWIDAHGVPQSASLNEVVYWNREAGVFVHAWRGRNAFWTPVIYDLKEVIVGEEPKIQGEFYEETTQGGIAALRGRINE